MFADTLAAVQSSVAPIAGLIALGYVWRLKSPGGIEALPARRTINALVMYAFYPGLAYHVISRVRFGPDFYWVPAYTWIGLLSAAALAALIFGRLPWFRNLSRPQLGALIIACSFGNILSMGISVLQPLYGPEAARYAIYADILGIGILFWTVGAGVAAAMGSQQSGFAVAGFLRVMSRMPPVWAFVAGAAVNVLQLPVPVWIGRLAELLGQAVVPSMLLTVGMSLSPEALFRAPRLIIAACALKLIVMPAVVAALCLPILGVNEMSQAIVLLAAMPTMMATVLLAERFGLDTELLAAVMVASTLAFFVILPVWLVILG